MTRRTRNNPSPSGLKSLSYGPKKRSQKKTEEGDYQEHAPTSTSTTTVPDKKSTQTKKRSRANSKPTDEPPAKKRSTRSGHNKTIEVEVRNEEDHDADDDGEADMTIAKYNTPHSSSSFHAKDNPMVGKQQETEDYSSEEQSTKGRNLEESHPEEHSSEGDLQEQEHADEYESQDVAREDDLRETVEDTDFQQRAEGYNSRDSSEEIEVQGRVSGEYPSEEVHPVQSIRSSKSQEQRTAHSPSPTPKPSPPKTITISRPYVHKPHFLTPKPTKPKQKILDSTSPTPKAPNSEPARAVRGAGDRLQFTRSAAMGNQQEEDDEEDPNKSISFLDPPVLTAAQKDQWKEQQRMFRGEAPRAVASKNSATKTSQNKSNAARALIEWAERDDTRKPPTPREMTALLDDFESRESANITERSRSRLNTIPRNRLLPAPRAEDKTPESKAGIATRAIPSYSNDAKSEVLVDEAKKAGRASIEKDSEVPPEIQIPQTPAPKSQESRGFWSGVSAITNIFASPLHFFDRRRNEQDSPAAGAIVTSTTGAQSTDTLTPSKPVTRPRYSHSERRSKAQSARNKRPQTERVRRHRDQPKPPIHLRGILTPDRAAEIHREQDRLAAARNKKRRAVMEQHETETDNEDPFMTPARVGEKRKRDKGTVRTPPACPPGTFRVPSPSSSDDSSDEGEPKEEPRRTRYSAIPITPRKDLISDDADASPFTSISRHPVPSTIWKVPEGYLPTYKEPLSSETKTASTMRPSPKKVSPQRSSPQKTSPQKTSPQKNSPKKASPKSSPTKKSVPGSSPTKKRAQAPQEPIDLSDSDSSFKVPYNDSGSDGDEEDLTQDEGSDTAQKENQKENQAPPPSTLQSKQWTQTPPPKPRPSNAQLPQVTPQVTSAEAAKARAEKFKPKQPSSLRNVTQMSPLQMEKENIMLRSQITSHGAFAQLLAKSGITLEEWQETDALQDAFFRNADREVIAAVNALSDDQVVEYPLPPALASILQPGQSEVEKEVERYFH